jgi:uncharacterized protein YcfL
VLVDATLVEQCSANAPELSNARQQQTIEFNIQTADELEVEAPAILQIDAMPVNPTVADCEMKTKLFVYDHPYAKDATGADAGIWIDIYSDDTTNR